MKQNLIFHQLFEKDTSTYTYLLGDVATKEAILIDPVLEQVSRDLQLIDELGLTLNYVLDTHVHADHITASGEIRKRTGARVGISSAYDLSCADLHLENEQELQFGAFSVRVLHTPGHTSGCLSFQVEDMVFTGDALLVRGCGRTDFQGGSAERLFESVRERLFRLPDSTTVYPAHDYKGFSKSSIEQEKRLNPRLNLETTKAQFVELMAGLKLAQPKKIQEAVPANLRCGLTAQGDELPLAAEGDVPSIAPEDLRTKLGQFKPIDVRGADEFNGELGHLPNAELVTLGSELDAWLSRQDKRTKIVFICRSGKRSTEATLRAQTQGFENVFSLRGGMLEWGQLRFPIERDLGGS